MQDHGKVHIFERHALTGMHVDETGNAFEVTIDTRAVCRVVDRIERRPIDGSGAHRQIQVGDIVNRTVIGYRRSGAGLGGDGVTDKEEGNYCWNNSIHDTLRPRQGG